MGINFPKHLLLFQIENLELAFKITETVACVSGGTGAKRTTLNASLVFDSGHNLKFSLG